MNRLTNSEVLALALVAFATGVMTTLIFLSLSWLRVMQ
jgi:hypothetical protein